MVVIDEKARDLKGILKSTKKSSSKNLNCIHIYKIHTCTNVTYDYNCFNGNFLSRFLKNCLSGPHTNSIWLRLGDSGGVYHQFNPCCFKDSSIYFDKCLASMSWYSLRMPIWDPLLNKRQKTCFIDGTKTFRIYYSCKHYNTCGSFT